MTSILMPCNIYSQFANNKLMLLEIYNTDEISPTQLTLMPCLTLVDTGRMVEGIVSISPCLPAWRGTPVFA